MSRRSSRYKGGVARGREEQPQGNSTMKRGSPITKKAGSRVIQRQGQFDFDMLVKIFSFSVTKVKIAQNL